MKQALLYILFFLIPQLARSQAVTLIEATDRLNPVAGFVNYADCAVDMNGDFLDDIVRPGGKGIYIDYQNEDGTFIQKFFNVRLSQLPSWSICAGDLDNNGLNDLLFANSAAVSFVLANDEGTVYTEDVMPGVILSQRSTMADINNDGWLDAFVCNDTAISIPYRNNGDGMMVPDLQLLPTSPRPGSYAAIWVDYDNDNDQDLYISKCKGGAPPNDPDRINLLYRNDGNGAFTEVASQAGLADNAQSWSTSFEDFDNDGDFDAFVVNHDFKNRLYRNNGNGTFTDVIAGSGINANDLGAFENSTGDFNNDGFIDIFSDLEQELYLGNGNLTFIGQQLSVIPGAIADLNDDGFLDVFRKSRMWINETNDNHWIKINTIGTVSNINGIGARVEIFGAWGRQIREVRSGQSYSPMSSLNVHFGLGNAVGIDSLIIKWPSGIITKLIELNVDTTYIVSEAECLFPATMLSITRDTFICPGSNLQLFAPGGFHEYQWSNGDTAHFVQITSEGRYYVLLSDAAGCISLSNHIDVSFIEETQPVITANTSNQICDGDTIILTSSPGMNYLWSDGSTEQSLIVTEEGNYHVRVDALCTVGHIGSYPFNVTVLASPAPVVSYINIDSTNVVIISATGENLHWYDLPSGGTLLDTGNIFETTVISNDTTFYVESHVLHDGELQTGGKTDTSGAGGVPTQVGYLIFEAWEPFTLQSVTVYLPPGSPAGLRIIQLVKGDTLLTFKSFMITPGLNVLELNFDIGIGQYSLRSPQGNLFRNEGSLSYPYPIGNAGRIITSSFGDDYYYFFYDWQIRTHDYECISDRIPVHVLISGVNEHSDALQWKLYPNPANQYVVIELPGEKTGWLYMADITGRHVYRKYIDGKRIHVDVSELPAGVYNLQLILEDSYESRILVIR